ncbi:unnamed protein product, partial [Ectocarpus sp. 12 AP-2014]
SCCSAAIEAHCEPIAHGRGATGTTGGGGASILCIRCIRDARTPSARHDQVLGKVIRERTSTRKRKQQVSVPEMRGCWKKVNKCGAV